MKKIVFCILIMGSHLLNPSFLLGQAFWTENFNNGCTNLCLANNYTSANGVWLVTDNSPSSDCGLSVTQNIFYISCAENGNAVGSCGTPCGNDATLHVGNDPLSPSAFIFCPTGDCGAEYDAGGYCGDFGGAIGGTSTITDIFITSPTINCSGKSSITVSFKYVEGGTGTLDNATIWYFDGLSWLQISDPPKTALCGTVGTWTAFSIALPPSADNNASVRIGVKWVNDDSGVGAADPSFAIDDLSLSSTSSSGAPVVNFASTDTVVCEKSCLDFYDLSTNNPTSWQWTFTGASPATSTLQNPTGICFNNYGPYNISLTATNAIGSGTATFNAFINIVQNPPAPTITSSGNLLTSSQAYAYQWYLNNTVIPGATQQSFLTQQAGNYYVIITDSNGCQSASNLIFISSIETTNGNFFSFYYDINSNVINCNYHSTKNYSCFLIDVNGRVVREASFASMVRAQIPTSNLSTGIYILNFVDNTTSIRYKIAIGL